jgi:dolichol kinase
VRILGLVLYTLFLVLFLLLEYSLRRDRNWRVPFASYAYEVMANDYETANKTLLGGIFIILSGMFLISFFDLYAALIGIVILAYADSAAAIIGKALPNHPLLYNRKKHVEGSLAFGAVGFLVTITSLHFTQLVLPTIIAASIIVSCTAAFVESLPLKYYYDNLTVPISAALLAQLFLSI